jgi:hypothetical protein
MKAAPLAGLVALALLSPSARAEDTVRVCIAASTAGQTFRKDGKLLAARDQMIACARDACPPIVRSHCARWLSEIDAAIPSVVLRAEDANGDDVIDASLSIDGRPGKLDGQPVRLDPGEHLVAIESADGAHKEERVLVAAGETSRVVTLRLPAPASAAAPSAPPAPSEPASPPARTTYVPTGAWVMGGAGILALGAATFFGVSANNALNTLDATCSPHCAEAQTDSGRTDAALFYVFVGVGGAAVATALVWGLAFPSHATATASAPRVEVRPVAALVAGGAVMSLQVSY